MKVTNRIHYGWVVVIGAFLCLVSFGLSRYLYPYVLPTMEAELNVLHETMGNIASTYFIGYAIMTFVWGILTDRIGPRKCMLLGHVVILIGFVGMGFMSSVPVGCFFYFLCGAGAAGLFVPAASLIPRWFGATRRGIALGITTAGMGVSPLVLGFAIPTVLSTLSWRWSWWIGAAFILIILIVCRFLLVETPAEKGLARIGANEEFSASGLEHVKKSPGQIEPKPSIRHILKQDTVWNLAGLYFMFGLGYTIFMTFAIAYLEEIGWEAQAAAAAFALWGALSIPSPIAWGFIADRLTKKYVFAIALALEAIGILVFLGGSPIDSYVGAAIVGFAYIGTPTVIAAAMADYYEPKVIGTTFGFITLCFGIGCIIGPTLGGVLADTTETLNTAILASLGATTLGVVLALFLKKPPKR